MSRRLDIGVASYGKNHIQLERTLRSIADRSTCDIHVYVVHNPSPGDDLTKEAICRMVAWDPRFEPVWMECNVGYAGACNVILARATTEYIAYLDNDAEINSPGWDETLCGFLDRFHEIGIIFPNGGAYMIDRGPYQEIEWGVGFCWVMNRMCASDLQADGLHGKVMRIDGRAYPKEYGVFDETLGHQDECDLALRIRMAGWKCAAVPAVSVSHKATATNDPASVERINRGVVNFVNKWNRIFYGKNQNYHSPNVGRWEEWPPNQIYMEQYWKSKPEVAKLNEAPEVMRIDGRDYDLIRIPKFKDFYRGRVF